MTGVMQVQTQKLVWNMEESGKKKGAVIKCY